MHKRTIQFLILSITVSTFSVSAFLFMIFNLQKNETELKEFIQVIANEGALRKDQQVLQEILVQSTDISDELHSYILSGDDGTVSFLSQIDVLADKMGVEVSTSKLEVVENKDGFNKLVVQFNFSGDESRVMRLIRIFEVLPYAGEVTDLSLTRSPNPTTGTNVLTGSVGLSLSITDI